MQRFGRIACRKALVLGLTPARAAVAHLMLGDRLADQSSEAASMAGEPDAVRREYREALKLAPESALAHVFDRVPDARDAFESPAGDLLVVLADSQLYV